jgi:hypothetical protein
VTVEHLGAGQGIAVPHLDRVVAQPGHDLGVVILQAVDALGVLGPAVDALQHVLAAPPVVLDRLNVFNDSGVQLAVEIVRGVVLAGPGVDFMNQFRTEFADNT